ncbi:MPN449 family protein [Mycoplasmoides pirum]|uniref:MPN449 family protein n=1 Tax=Mycoplasmoides pirum TaxID=2122 RepID=UPI00047F958E|nr:hypothetical protein [Mycoplasmoides pirum]
MSKTANDLIIISRQYLGTIFGNTTLSNRLKNDDNFSNVIKKEIGIHNNLENIINSDDRITSKYLENYKKHTNKEIDLTEFENITDLDDIQDEINYLNVMVKNLFDQKDLSSFPLDLNNNVHVEGVINSEEESKNKVDNSNYSNDSNDTTNVEPLHGERIRNSNFSDNKTNSFNQQRSSNNQSSSFNNFPFANITQQSVDMLYRASAAKKLEYEMQVGKIYRWKEKPRAIYILQFFAIFASLLFVLSGLALVISWIYAASNGLMVNNPNSNQNNAPTNIAINGGQTFSFILPAIIMIGFGLNMLIRYSNDSLGKISSFKKNKLEQILKMQNQSLEFPKVNQNLQYHFYFNSIVIAFVFFLFFALIPIANSPMQVIVNINVFSLNNVYGINVPMIEAIYICNIIFLVLFAPLLLVGITGKVLNPKPDEERLQKILNNYVEEMKKEGIDPTGGNPFGPVSGFGGPFGL